MTPEFLDLSGPAIVAKARYIKDQGNRAAHASGKPMTVHDVTATLREVFHLCYWIARTYAKGAKPDAGLVFDPAKLEKRLSISASTVEQISKLRIDHADAEVAPDQRHPSR